VEGEKSKKTMGILNQDELANAQNALGPRCEVCFSKCLCAEIALRIDNAQLNADARSHCCPPLLDKAEPTRGVHAYERNQ
jgi:hypothetical protein